MKDNSIKLVNFQPKKDPFKNKDIFQKRKTFQKLINLSKKKDIIIIVVNFTFKKTNFPKKKPIT